jgi:hypothetical protein
MREEYLGKEAHDLPLLLDPEGEGRLVGPQEVFGMARNQLIDDGDTTVLATWMTLRKTCPYENTTSNSVAHPDPSDPHVFGPPGSGSVSQRYGSGSVPDPSIVKQK